MNRMFTKQEIIDLIEEHAPGFDPSAIEEGNIPQDAVLGIEDGEVVKGSLQGKYVEIMPPPESSTLTEEEQEKVKDGVFIEGDYANLKNPLFFPSGILSAGDRYFGVVCGTDLSDYEKNPLIFKSYMLGNASRLLGIGVDLFSIDPQGERVKILKGLEIYGKGFPNYPNNASGKTFHFTLDDNSVTWHEGNGLYLHTIVFDVGLSNTFTLRFISDSSSACELDTVNGNFHIPNATFIQPANMGNVVIVPLDANHFAPDIYAFNSTAGTFSDNITLASVTSDTVTPIG